MRPFFLRLFFIALIVLSAKPLLAGPDSQLPVEFASGSTMIFLSATSGNDSLPVKNFNVKNDPLKKRLVSALFAFPFPFGFVGAHRIMLGTKPWVPVIYVATFGGCFGLLPLIDFCVIVFSKDFEQYENNPNLFMWVK